MTNFKPSYVLGADGPLADALPNYEVRQPQILLGEDIQKAFQEASHLVAEAATGTGKSFAAILAAIEKSLASETPIVISTHTIALQEQLFHKDIPFMLQHMNLQLKICLAKGRGNYVSLRRTKYAHKKMSKNYDTKSQYQKLQSWISNSKAVNGNPPSKSDLPFKPSSTLWSAVRSDSDDCLGEKCPTFKSCHYQNSRKQLEKANIIVTNHTMVMLDRKMKGSGLPGILPDYQFLVLDEAHEIESVARQVFTFEMKENGIKKVLGEIYSEDGLGILNPAYERYSQGSLVDLLSKTEEPEDPHKQIIMDTVHSVQGLLNESEEFFKKVSLFLNGKPVRRFTKPDEISTTLYDLFKVFLGNLKLLPKAVSSKHDKQKIEYVARRSTEIALGLDKILTLPNAAGGKKYPEVVAWGMSRYNPAWKSKTLSVVCAPIFLKSIMKRLLFAPLSSVVMMSATLATSGNDPFRTFKSIIGLDKPMQRRLPSVFDYQKQVKVYIVKDMPEQKAPNYIPVLSEQVSKFVSASKGGALVLFTSFDTMKKVYGSTKDGFEMQGLDLFLQGGPLSRNKMIEGFKNTKRGVLYGVASFWTGVDIPGNSLRTLIITKLPFTPPDDPLQQAQEQIYKQYKRSYFMERALPHTALMLKQGFGRLIRRSTDTGTVVMLDSRVVTKRYGKFLLNSLPSCTTKRVSHKAVVKE
jgi:ATP-dependent DNA helicase DinG